MKILLVKLFERTDIRLGSYKDRAFRPSARIAIRNRAGMEGGASSSIENSRNLVIQLTKLEGHTTNRRFLVLLKIIVDKS